MAKMSLSIFSVFVALMLMFSVSAATDTQETAAGDGFNDPDTFGDPQDDGLDWGTIGTDTENQETTRSARDTTGTVGQSNNTWENDTVGANNTTVTRSSSQGVATRGNTSNESNTTADQRAAREMCTSADSQRMARDFANQQGDFTLADSERFDTEEQATLYVFTSTQRSSSGVSEQNLQRMGLDDEESDTARSARETASGTLYVIVGGCEVKGAISDDSLMYMPAEGDTRAARDADSSGFVTLERNMDAVDDRWRSEDESADDERNARDTTSTAPWNNIGRTTADEDERSSTTRNNVNLPSYVSNSDDAEDDN